MIRFMNMIKEGGILGADTLYFYIKGYTKNDCNHAFNSLKVLYWKQNVFTFDNFCNIFNTRNNVEVIQMFHKKCFDLESLLNDLWDRPDPKTFNINHVFQVKKSRHVLVFVKGYMAR